MPSDDLMPDLLQEISLAEKPRTEEAGAVSDPPAGSIPAVKKKKIEREEEKKEEVNAKPSSSDEGTVSFLKPPFTSTLSISMDSGLKNSLQNGLNQMLNAGDYRYGDLSDLIREALTLYLQGALKPMPHPLIPKGKRVQLTLRLNDRFKAMVKERMPKK